MIKKRVWVLISSALYTSILILSVLSSLDFFVLNLDDKQIWLEESSLPIEVVIV